MMPITPISTVIELFYPEGYAHDYEWTARALGIKHFAVRNDTYVWIPYLLKWRLSLIHRLVPAQPRTLNGRGRTTPRVSKAQEYQSMAPTSQNSSKIERMATCRNPQSIRTVAAVICQITTRTSSRYCLSFICRLPGLHHDTVNNLY